MRRGGSPYNALSEGCSVGRADPPQEDEGMGDNTEMGTLAVTEELHAKQRKRRARKPSARPGRRRRTRLRMRRAKPGNQRPKGSAARSQSSSRSTRNRRPSLPGYLVTELDGTPS